MNPLAIIEKYYASQPELHKLLLVHSTQVAKRALRVADAHPELGLDRQFLMEAALLHDIGIIPARKEFGSGSGKFQEKVSDPLVREMLGSLGFDPAVIDRAAYVVSHHHTYKDIDGIDYQILVEAEFLVNLFEEDEPRSAVESVAQKIFKTETGRKLLEQMFLAPQQTPPKAVRG